MANRNDLDVWLESALRNLGGRGGVVEICKHVWQEHQSELEASGDLFYTCQYDIRWAANRLRRKKIMKSVEVSPAGIGELAGASEKNG